MEYFSSIFFFFTKEKLKPQFKKKPLFTYYFRKFYSVNIIKHI